jgi:hypothetical protein
VVECLPGVSKTLDPIPSATIKEQQKKERMKLNPECFHINTLTTCNGLSLTGMFC